MTVTTANLGFPRIGPRRELKTATEAYWAGKIDQALWDENKVAVMPIPGLNPGEVGKSFSGGSTIAIAKNAQYKTKSPTKYFGIGGSSRCST